MIIPPLWVKSAIDAHIKLGIKPTGVRMAGLDVADEGGDTNSLAIRKSFLLDSVDEWGQGDTTQTAQKAVGLCKDNDVLEMY